MSGCGDSYAAGVGVSVAAMQAVGDGGLSDVLVNAFVGATSVSRTIRDAAAVSQGIAVAFGASLPCECARIQGCIILMALHCGCRHLLVDIAEMAPPRWCVLKFPCSCIQAKLSLPNLLR